MTRSTLGPWWTGARPCVYSKLNECDSYAQEGKSYCVGCEAKVNAMLMEVEQERQLNEKRERERFRCPYVNTGGYAYTNGSCKKHHAHHPEHPNHSSWRKRNRRIWEDGKRAAKGYLKHEEDDQELKNLMDTP